MKNKPSIAGLLFVLVFAVLGVIMLFGGEVGVKASDYDVEEISLLKKDMEVRLERLKDANDKLEELKRRRGGVVFDMDRVNCDRGRIGSGSMYWTQGKGGLYGEDVRKFKMGHLSNLDQDFANLEEILKRIDRQISYQENQVIPAIKRALERGKSQVLRRYAELSLENRRLLLEQLQLMKSGKVAGLSALEIRKRELIEPLEELIKLNKKYLEEEFLRLAEVARESDTVCPLGNSIYNKQIRDLERKVDQYDNQIKALRKETGIIDDEIDYLRREGKGIVELIEREGRVCVRAVEETVEKTAEIASKEGKWLKVLKGIKNMKRLRWVLTIGGTALVVPDIADAIDLSWRSPTERVAIAIYGARGACIDEIQAKEFPDKNTVSLFSEETKKIFDVQTDLMFGGTDLMRSSELKRSLDFVFSDRCSIEIQANLKEYLEVDREVVMELYPDLNLDSYLK